MPSIRILIVLLATGLLACPASGVNVVIDYTYDEPANGGAYFFPPGSESRAALDAAAGFFSEILDDTFVEIRTPEPYESQVFDGVFEWRWSQSFNHPATAAPITIPNPTIPEDTYLIYAGARNLAGATLGRGGPGAYNASWGPTVNGFTAQEGEEIDAISAAFSSALSRRGEPDGFARWGGTLTFDNANDNWHFDHTTPPTAGEDDFYSFVLHELGHALGLGTADEWDALVSGAADNARFIGAAASAEHGGPVPLAYDVIDGTPIADTGHWRDDVKSTVLGGSAVQETVMDPSLTTGTRALLTKLDAAGLVDIGWTVVEPAGPSGDLNEDGLVDALDYVVWRETSGAAEAYAAWRAGYGSAALAPEPDAVPAPASLALAAWAGVCAGHRRRTSDAQLGA